VPYWSLLPGVAPPVPLPPALVSPRRPVL